jgi:hypothetical protein
MSGQGWVDTLTSAQTAGPALSAFTTAISCLPTPARHTIPPDDWEIGKSLWIRASGGISNVVTTSPTFTFEFRLGPTSNIVAWSSGAIVTSTTAHTLVPWWLDIQLTCRAIGGGTSGNLIGQGLVVSRAFIDVSGVDVTTTGHPALMVPETSPAVGTGFDTNVANIADLFVACQTSAAGNAITLHQYQLLSMNYNS